MSPDSLMDQIISEISLLSLFDWRQVSTMLLISFCDSEHYCKWETAIISRTMVWSGCIFPIHAIRRCKIQNNICCKRTGASRGLIISDAAKIGVKCLMFDIS
jgi:hypothetical protein